MVANGSEASSRGEGNRAPGIAAALGLGSDAEALRLLTWALFVLVVAGAGGLYAGNALNAERPWVNHDVAYHSYLGWEMLNGSRLYIDLLEDNPPGNVLLLAGLIGVADTFGLPDFLLQHVFVLLLGVAGLAVLQSATPKDHRGSLVFMIAGLAYLVVLVRGNFSNSIYASAPGLPYDFGQREHLFSLLFVPYLLLRVSGRAIRRPVYLFLALLGFVSTFKPFWAPMIAVVEGYCLLRKGPRQWAAPLSVGAGILMVLLFLLLHSPASFLTFFRENIPMYLRGGYTHYDTTLAEFLASPLHWQMVGGGILLIGGAAVCALRRNAERASIVLLLVSAGIAYYSVIHQHKFWSYHVMPFFALTVVPGGWLLGSAAADGRTIALRRWLTAAAAIIAVATCGITLAGTSRMLRDYPPLGDALVPLVEPYEKTMFFSMSVTTSYAPLILRKPIVGPYTVFLDLPELLATDDAEQRAELLARYAAEVNSVIDRERPDALVYSPNRQALPDDRSLHDVLVDIGVDPTAHGYRLVPAPQLMLLDPRLARWIVYERDDSLQGLAAN